MRKILLGKTSKVYLNLIDFWREHLLKEIYISISAEEKFLTANLNFGVIQRRQYENDEMSLI